MPETEADTCRKLVTPKISAAGWTDEQISEQKTFTDGRIIVVGNRIRRRKQKRADYLLRLTRDFPIAIVEAKAHIVRLSYFEICDPSPARLDGERVLSARSCSHSSALIVTLRSPSSPGS